MGRITLVSVIRPNAYCSWWSAERVQSGRCVVPPSNLSRLAAPLGARRAPASGLIPKFPPPRAPPKARTPHKKTPLPCTRPTTPSCELPVCTPTRNCDSADVVSASIGVRNIDGKRHLGVAVYAAAHGQSTGFRLGGRRTEVQPGIRAGEQGQSRLPRLGAAGYMYIQGSPGHHGGRSRGRQTDGHGRTRTDTDAYRKTGGTTRAHPPQLAQEQRREPRKSLAYPAPTRRPR